MREVKWALNGFSYTVMTLVLVVHACHLVGIQVHEHIIISMFDDRYYSFADNGIIKQIYDQID